MTEDSNLFIKALMMVFSSYDALHNTLWEIVGLSLFVSLWAIFFAALIGLPLGAIIASSRFKGRGVVIIILNSLMGVPPVVVGLVVYILLSANGVFGLFKLLYSPTAMIIAQFLLITPLITALGLQIIENLNEEYNIQFLSWRLTLWQRIKTLLVEGRSALLTVLLAGFGRAISEVGAVMIVGGNIEHSTRTMTTAIQMEISKGNLELAMALGIILLTLAFIINALAHFFKTGQNKIRQNKGGRKF